jgi:hypothetical protein
MWLLPEVICSRKPYRAAGLRISENADKANDVCGSFELTAGFRPVIPGLAAPPVTLPVAYVEVTGGRSRLAQAGYGCCQTRT